MGQSYVLTSASQMDGADNHGNVSYWCNIEGSDLGVLIVQKPTSPAPQPGTQIFGRMESAESKAGNDYLRFRREQREDGAAPSSVREGARGDSSGGSPSPEFWAQKDKRLARAGMTQAVVSGHPRAEGEHVDAYVLRIAALTDVLLENLDIYAPSPNQSSPGAATSPPTEGGGAATGTHNPPPGAQAAAPTSTAPAPESSDDLKLALAACGHDNSNPQATIASLTPEQVSQVNLIHSNLKSKGEATVSDDRFNAEPMSNFVPDSDDSPPF